jgi:hypothetical protein
MKVHFDVKLNKESEETTTTTRGRRFDESKKKKVKSFYVLQVFSSMSKCKEQGVLPPD